MTKLRVYVNASNLFVISNFKLWDPEMGANGLGYRCNAYSISAFLSDYKWEFKTERTMKKYKFPVWRKIKIGGWVACCALLSASCNSFLDIVPDNVAVIDHAFSNAMEAEKYLFTCYSYLPGTGEPSGNIGMTAGDEIWLNMPNHVPSPAWDYIAKGVRSADRSQPDWWKGSDYAFSLFMGIRDCNTFLENIEDTSKVADLTVDKRARWIAEAKFLKAYYHYYLLRTYGPIPIVDKNLPVSASPEAVQVKRQPFDDCVKYIVGLLDECNPACPP